MRKIYSLKKDILFKNNIYDILSIALDKKINIEEYSIKGVFNISGEYLVKENEKDDFDIEIPYLNYIEDEYDISNIKIDVDDFYYEIKDSNVLVINIDIVVDGLEERERCIDITDEEIINNFDENIKDEKEEKIIMNNNINVNNNDYITYKICIVRENDTIESIIDKYNTTLDNIKKYNVINDLRVGDKIIIPYEKN